MKVNNKLVIAAVLCAVGTLAATQGDQHPMAKYGSRQVSGYDAGLQAPICINMPNQNSIMVRNLQIDGGTGATLYCGFDTSVAVTTGMPLQANETLTIDVVALTSGALDGGPNTQPRLCCIGAPGSNPADLHYMIVK